MALKAKNHTVWLASHNASNDDGVIDLGKLSGYSDYLKFGQINKIVKDLNPDVVHAHVLNHYGLMSLMQPKPLVVALWGSDVMLAPHTGLWIKKYIYKKINALVLRIAARCHTSGHHVAAEADKQYGGALAKTKIFYWGFPLSRPNENELNDVARNLKAEFGIKSSEKYIVFPRGLGEVYNPRLVARIIRKIMKGIDSSKRIVVLKGFATKRDEELFSCAIPLAEITYINRLMTDSELYYLYSKTFVHVSVPVSDSLGGGVIEPTLLGSFPVLSSLPSYQQYALRNPAHIIPSEQDSELDVAAQVILSKTDIPKCTEVPAEYLSDHVVEELECLYIDAINKKYIPCG